MDLLKIIRHLYSERKMEGVILTSLFTLPKEKYITNAAFAERVDGLLGIEHRENLDNYTHKLLRGYDYKTKRETGVKSKIDIQPLLESVFVTELQPEQIIDVANPPTKGKPRIAFRLSQAGLERVRELLSKWREEEGEVLDLNLIQHTSWEEPTTIIDCQYGNALTWKEYLEFEAVRIKAADPTRIIEIRAHKGKSALFVNPVT